MHTLLQDIRYAWRQLRKSPAFTAVAVITLALGIGANTAIFGLLDQALLRSLPVGSGAAGHSEILRRFGAAHMLPTISFVSDVSRSARCNPVFGGLIATVNAEAGVQWHNQPELVTTEVVSGNYFDVLGVQPELGRLLVQSDDSVPHANPVAVLSFDYWQRRFGADRGLLNQAILVTGHRVHGGWRGPTRASTALLWEYARPLHSHDDESGRCMPGGDELEERKASWLNIIGRLQPR